MSEKNRAFSKEKRPFKNGNRPARPVQPKPRPLFSAARMAAVEAVYAVLHNDAYASEAIDAQLRNAGLSQADQRLCTGLVYKTLENLIAIDFALSGFLKDADALEEHVRDILRISACQALFMDRIPENAIADEAVRLTRALKLEGLTGLVNGVVRNLLRGKNDIPWPKEDEGERYLSIRYSMPEWLVSRLIKAYGEETAKEIIMFRTQEHFMTVRPNMLKLTDEAFEKLLQKKVWQTEKGIVPHAYHIREASQIARDVDFRSGLFSIQGESSMLCAQIAHPARASQVLDCCAAPGGKTAYMAEMMGGTGRIYAWDIHDHRVALLKAMAQRLQLDNVRPAVHDACVLKDDMVGTMDLVLLDAPCSGLGVMDDKPDIKYRVSEKSISELTQIQKKLLDTCCQYVKRGGTLVYSTCSILPEENALQAEAFLKDHPEFEMDDMSAFMDTRFARHIGPFGLQLLESRDGVEGFFIARMKRVRY